MRKASCIRNTNETQIELSLCLEGSGKADIKTECGFLKHMLILFAKHARVDLNLRCVGDSEVDFHHTVEDIGIVLGMAFQQALGEKRGIARYGQWLLPMDEALVLVSLDLSGRSCLGYKLQLPHGKVGEFDLELVKEFLLGFVRSAGLTLHVQQLAGENTHHIVEAMFKGLGRAIKQAISIEEAYKDEIPSTKGML